MNRFALIGASYKTAGVERLGQLALPKDKIAERLPALAEKIGAQELAYIGTCNRVEFVLAGETPLAVQTCRYRLGQLLGAAPLPEIETSRIFRAWTDEGAVEHLFLVASGLDSAQAGEREIYAQVRGAWTTARAAGTCGPQLDYIFGEALRAAQDVHQQAARPSNADSLANYAVKRAEEHMTGRTAPHVALVGVSPMTRHCARAFAAKGQPMTIVNRTLESAQEFAVEVHAKALALDAFRADVLGLRGGVFDVIITAVGGAEPVLDKSLLQKLAAMGHDPLLIDLGVPPNVDPEAAEAVGLHRVGMDEVIADASSGRAAKLGELASARVLIDEHLQRLRSEYAVREAAPLLQRLSTQYQNAAVESLRRLPKGDEESLRLWAESFARRMAHAPMKGLRALAAEAGPEAVRAYMEGVEEALKDIPKEKSS